MRRGHFMAAVALGAAVAAGAAMARAAAPELGGYAAAHAGLGTADFDDRGAIAGGTLNLRATADLGGGLRVGAQSVVQMAAFGDAPFARHLLREAYVEWRGGKADVLIGRRVLVWGTGDGFNPTSTLTPTDYRFLAYEDFAERFGVDVARARLFLSERWSVTGYALPHFRSSILPEGQIPALLRRLPNRDDGRPGPIGAALRLEQRGEGLDFSLVAHRGRATAPAFGFSALAGPLSFNPRLTMLGFDIAATTGSLRLFAEGAWLDYGGPDDATALPAFVPRDEAALVVGVERELEGGARVQLQGLFRHRAAEAPLPAALDALRSINRVTFGQFRRTDAGAVLTGRADIDGERLVADVTGAHWFTDGSWYARARLKARIDQRQSFYLRGDLFRGRADSVFGSLRSNSRLLLEYRIGF